MFGSPFLVVLDEPNSNLDPVGEQSLNEAIQRMRLKGQIVVIVAHRPSAIFAANKILSLRNGRAEMFGSKKHVLAALFPRAGQPHKPAEVVNGGAHATSSPAAQSQANEVACRSDEISVAANVTSLDLNRTRRNLELANGLKEPKTVAV